MKTSEPPEFENHPDELLYPYVEGLLSLEENDKVGEHLRGCRRCAAKVDQLRETVSRLAVHKEAFCPELWELDEFANYGIDRDGTIAQHVEDCPSCREVCRNWTAATQTESMPSELRARLKSRLPRRASLLDRAERRLRGSQEGLRSFFKIPAFAVGLTVAALLLVMLLPREVPQSVVALSQVTWSGVPKPKAFDVSRKRACILVALMDFPEAWSQSRIDDLYEALAPHMDIFERYEMVPPADVAEAVRSSSPAPKDTAELMKILNRKLRVAVAVIVKVQPGNNGMRVVCELMDYGSGKTIVKELGRAVPETELPSQINREISNMLLSQLQDRKKGR